MKTLNLITLALVIVGGINWLFVGAGQFDVVASLFGGSDTGAARLVYVLVGLSAIYQMMPFFKAMGKDEVPSLRDR